VLIIARNGGISKMSNKEKVIDYLREHPQAKDTEIAEIVGLTVQHVKTIISRAKSAGCITVTHPEGARSVQVNEAESITKNDYKREIFEEMIDQYMVDFREVTMYQDRINIGQIVYKLVKEL
jgi:hypothetical protein